MLINNNTNTTLNTYTVVKRPIIPFTLYFYYYYYENNLTSSFFLSKSISKIKSHFL